MRGESIPALLLATKLHLPQPRPLQVLRLHLFARLNAAHNAQNHTPLLTLVSAPAGFGKTTLLGEWLRQSGRRTAWVSLDADDNDPIRFWTYFIAALQKVHPDAGKTALALLHSPQPPHFDAYLTALLNDITALDDMFIYVLDDYHVINSKPIHEGVIFLLDHLPAQMRLVITTRADPPFPLARLRARGQLLELRAADLRFSQHEAQMFLHQATGLAVTPEQAETLDQHVEGWVAGLQLAALALQTRAPTPHLITQFIQDFTGSGHRFILDYLTDEVLRYQSEEIQAFLLKTSILDRMCSPLCEAVTSHPDSQIILDELERRNLFITPLDNERRWFRYHHLFANLLKSRLQSTHRNQSPELHRKASAWLESAGLTFEAINHALAAQDFEHAADLVQRHSESMWTRGELITMERWLGAIPTSIIGAHPNLMLAHAWTHFLLNPYRLSEIEFMVGEAEKASGPDADEKTRGVAATIKASIASNREDLAQAIELSHTALRLLPQKDIFWRLVPTIDLGLAYDAAGRVEAAAEYLNQAIYLSAQIGNRYAEMVATGHLGRVRAAQGQLHAAAMLHRHALQIAAEQGWQQLPMMGLPHVWLAQLLYEWNDLEDATRHATEGISCVAAHHQHERILMEGYAVLARIRHAQGDDRAALDLLQQCERVAQRINMPWATARVRAYQARGWLAQGLVEQASRWLQEAGLGPNDELSSQREYEYTTMARVLLAQGNATQAVSTLTRVLESARSGGRLQAMVEAAALRALAFQLAAWQEQALGSLHESVELAAPEGYVRTFIDLGEPMRRLMSNLRSQLGKQIPLALYLDQIMAAFPASPPADKAMRMGAADQPSIIHHLVEPLSPRELQVLRMVAQGLTNQEIAERLVVALSTVKAHTNSIFGKMGVKSRTQAIARARELDLL